MGKTLAGKDVKNAKKCITRQGRRLKRLTATTKRNNLASLLSCGITPQLMRHEPKQKKKGGKTCGIDSQS